MKGMERFRALFLRKFSENIAIIRTCMERWIAAPEEFRGLDPLYRKFHNIKSDAGMMGYSKISRMAMLVEMILEKMQDGSGSSGPEDEDFRGRLRLILDVAEYFRLQLERDLEERSVDMARDLEESLETVLKSYSAEPSVFVYPKKERRGYGGNQ